jgi:hypothetical protein
MFKIFTLPYLQAAIALPTAFYVLTQYSNIQPVQAALYVTVINIGVHMIVFLITYTIARISLRTLVPWVSIGKYLVACAVTAAALYMLPHPSTLALTLITVLAGAFVYAVLVLAIDNHARMLVVAMIQEIGSRLPA